MQRHLNAFGVAFIVLLQKLPMFHSSRWQSFWLLFTKLGDPNSVFVLFGPLLFPFLPSLTLRFVFVGAVAEYLNVVLKWILFADRPYWWIYMTDHYGSSKTPQLEQFPLTCETGPGSPSGHAMVSAAVWFVFLIGLENESLSRYVPKLGWVAYAVFLTLVAISRLYIAAHFPHQLILGVISGMLLAWWLHDLVIERCSMSFFVYASMALVFLAFSVSTVMQITGLDPHWSLTVAERYCARPEWIHPSTTPFASYFRTVGVILSLGCCVLLQSPFIVDAHRPKMSHLQQVTVSAANLIATKVLFSLPIHVLPLKLFYCALLLLNFLNTVLYVVFIPYVVTRGV